MSLYRDNTSVHPTDNEYKNELQGGYSTLVSPQAGMQIPMSRSKDTLAPLSASLRGLFRLKNSLQEADVHLLAADELNQLESAEFELSLPVDPETQHEYLRDLVLRLQESLPVGFQQLDQGVLEVVGRFPVGAGGVADIWLGMMGNRKVAIKSYRRYSSSDWLPSCVVSRTCP